MTMPRRSKKGKTKVSPAIRQYVRGAIERKGMREVENTEYGSSVNVTSNGAAGNFVCLTDAIDPGDGYEDRTTDILEPKSLDINFIVKNNTSNADSEWVRLVVFQWYQDSEAEVPVYADLFDTHGGSNLQRFINRGSVKQRKLKVLYDTKQAIEVPPYTDGATVHPGRKTWIKEVHVPARKMKPIRYKQGQSAGIQYAESGAIYLFHMSSTDTAGQIPTMDYQTSMRLLE